MVLPELPKTSDIDEKRSLYKTNAYMVKIPNMGFPYSPLNNDKMWLFMRNTTEVKQFKLFLREDMETQGEPIFWVPKLPLGRSCDIGSIFMKTQNKPRKYTFMNFINNVIADPNDKPKPPLEDLHIAKEVKFHCYDMSDVSLLHHKRYEEYLNITAHAAERCEVNLTESITLTLRNIRKKLYSKGSAYTHLQLTAFNTWPGAKSVTPINKDLGGSMLGPLSFRPGRIYIVHHIYYADIIFERVFPPEGWSRACKSASYLAIPIAFSFLKYKVKGKTNRLDYPITPNYNFEREDQPEFIFNKPMPFIEEHSGTDDYSIIYDTRDQGMHHSQSIAEKEQDKSDTHIKEKNEEKIAQGKQNKTVRQSKEEHEKIQSGCCGCVIL